MLGPATGDKEIDYFARHLAVDLFVNPVGVRFLAETMLAKAVLQPKSPQPGECIMAVFDAVLSRGRDIDFAYDGVDPDSGEAVLYFTADAGARLALAVTASHLKKAGCWRTFKALACLLQLPGAWLHTSTDGHLVRLRLTSFSANPILSYFYDPEFLALLMLEHLLVDCLAPSPALASSPLLYRVLLRDLATLFAQYQMDQVAQLLETGASMPPAELCAAIRQLAGTMKEKKRIGGRMLLRHWARSQ